ncbi:putative serine/threonine protein phosphatase [Mortierella sp. GBA43]|nr:putative serine/threonine protein phosphatase [Mortierella sp. GBA43]
MEGFQVLFDNQLSTVWSAPNYCYRCGNLASILEVGVDGERHFNVFEAAPENERPTGTEQRSVFANGGAPYANGTSANGSNGSGSNGSSTSTFSTTSGSDSSQDAIHYFL